MNEFQASDFPAFFHAIHGHEPFPWQRMLVEHVVSKDAWPEGIDLPTASGKTACIDAAIFLLALAERDGCLPAGHPARRRLFFVVDRRIVVDEAYRRAEKLAGALENAQHGIAKRVADRLRALGGGATPLVVSRLRGGALKDEAWRLSPAQPAVVTSTVDQLGSRLLFRGYGSSALSAPIEAALTGCDSLILLDEAHCAVPFMQTARAIQRYASADWMEGDPVAAPLSFCILSATLPDDVQDVFPGPNRKEEALDHYLLKARITAAKPAELVQANSKKDHEDPLAGEAVKRAIKYTGDGFKRVAIMVNRVATAAAIAETLRQKTRTSDGPPITDVVLMTGRMRPLDRDNLVKQWAPLLQADTKQEPARPIVFVTTQCLEVGADFSFDALITECASLDALRQRFGRLNRLGECGDTAAAVVIRKSDAKAVDKLVEAKPLDPIYGNAMARTWHWLKERAANDAFDFGIEAMAAHIEEYEREGNGLGAMNAPSSDAPVILPAHVDFLCQTAPQPAPDPDPAVFLHGPRRGAPEVRIVFRTDLGNPGARGWQSTWLDTLALLPPLTGEALSVPLWLARKWLADQLQREDADQLGDVEGETGGDAAQLHGRVQPYVIWRGRNDSKVSQDVRDLRPNDRLVVPADAKLVEQLRHAFTRPEGAPLDMAEEAYRNGRERPVLRLTPAVFKQERLDTALASAPPLEELLSWARNEDRERDELPDLLQDVQDRIKEAPEPNNLPSWIRAAIAAFAAGNLTRIEAHPAGGVVLMGAPMESGQPFAPDLDFGDMDDALSGMEKEVSLTAHTGHVGTRAERWASSCLPEPYREPVGEAARLHDLGKADPRFQIILHGDEIKAAVRLSQGSVLAKSNGLNRPPSVQQRLREAAGLPEGRFPHEMLSLQLAETALESLPAGGIAREVTLHLIASHHGHARPFAPVYVDENPPPIEIGAPIPCSISAQARLEGPPYRLDSGVAERFWKLNRYVGWWGLAYLEAVVRLADRAASASEAMVQQTQRSKETAK
ncbi:MAG: type I-U CRISPR-associated helicase/endonuclease Cas3 [Candidatus Hydrogenedentota bacterium]